MKATLSTPNCSTSNEKLTSENKQSSPSSSPRSSPRPSPRPHLKWENHLSVNYNKEATSSRHDGSPSSQEGSITSRCSNMEITPPSDLNNKPDSSGSSSNKDKKEARTKKKSWFNSFNPTYKSRSDELKKIFKEIPDDERLIIDYSCALQRDILLQGRIYVTQNYLCFYSNIFGWEKILTLKWKEVTSINKDKTALVFPNALTIIAHNENFFFTTFHARDKTYVMLFRIWQNALMNQPMQPGEMWQAVHQSYGDDLGLTSDDEDYIAPGTEEDKLSTRLSNESFSEQESVGPLEMSLDPTMSPEEVSKPPINLQESAPININNSHHQKRISTHEPTDLSDTTESDVEKNAKYDIKVQCTGSHEGRVIMNEVFPIHIDQLFTQLFTSSEFFLDFHRIRKTTDLSQTQWIQNTSDSTKLRVVNLTLALNQAVGPKSAQVTENQVLLSCSKAGHLYAIDVESINSGIPYADSFKVVVHHCLKKISETESSYQVIAQVVYRKSVWGLVKGMIEKSCWAGLDDFFTALTKALQAQTEDSVSGETKRKSRRKRRIHPMARTLASEDTHINSVNRRRLPVGVFRSDLFPIVVFAILIILVGLNAMLYFKLQTLEEAPPYTLLDLHILKNPPKSHDEWLVLLQQQETLHSVEIQKWQRVLKSAIQLLKQTEESLGELQKSVGTGYTSKVMSILQNHKDTVEQTHNMKQDL